MAVKNSIPQFDSSKTNLGTAPVDGFKANTIVKSEEVNRAIYDCSLSITALINALINTNGGLHSGSSELDNSQSVDEIARQLSAILGMGLKNASLVSPTEGDDYITADGFTFNGYNLELTSIDMYDGTTIGRKNGSRVLFDYPLNWFLINQYTFCCVPLSKFNSDYKNSFMPITAFFRVNSDTNTNVVNIEGQTIPFVASKGDTYPMYKQLQIIYGNYYFNLQYDKSNNAVNTIMLLGTNANYGTWKSDTIPCPDTGTIYVVAINKNLIV